MPAQSVALLISSFAPGGVQRIMVNLANELGNQAYLATLVAVSGHGPLRSKVSSAVRIKDLKSSRGLFSLAGLIRFLKDERPAVLISGQTHLNALCAIANRLAGRPSHLIVAEHNHMSSVIKSGKSLVDRLRPLWARIFYPWADEIVAVSEEVASDLANLSGIEKHRIKVVYNPIIDPILLQQKELHVDHPWFSEAATPIVIGVGRLSPQKGFSGLVKAITRVNRVRPVRLVILGEGDERENLENLIRNLGMEENVWLPGYVDNPFAYINGANLFVLSSLWEGLPSVLVEAMACGTSVLSTDCPAGPSEILEGGKFGRLIPVGDLNAMTQGILDGLAHAQDPGALIQRASLFFSPVAVQGYIDLFPQPRVGQSA
jgi:glycosyltransferase involved in cell wall biosynthesis